MKSVKREMKNTAHKRSSHFQRTINNLHSHQHNSFVWPQKPNNQMTDLSIDSKNSADLVLVEE